MMLRPANCICAQGRSTMTQMTAIRKPSHLDSKRQAKKSPMVEELLTLPMRQMRGLMK